MPAPARLIATGCTLLACALLTGCGGGSDSTGVATGAARDATVTSGKDSAPPSHSQAKRAQASPAGACQTQLGGFVASMDSLRRRLAVGLTYDQYVAEVRGIRSTYGKIPTDRVELDCLGAVGTPAEQAFNRYIEAANDWGECVSEAGCTSAAVEPVLQRRWRIASHFLSGADQGLEASAP